jgi:hypothetical protein
VSTVHPTNIPALSSALWRAYFTTIKTTNGKAVNSAKLKPHKATNLKAEFTANTKTFFTTLITTFTSAFKKAYRSAKR